MVRVFVGPIPQELDVLPAGTAGAVADALAGGATPGVDLSLKADGVVLGRSAKVPAGVAVVEVIDVTGEIVAAQVAPVPDPV
jgi:hypothetical protein